MEGANLLITGGGGFLGYYLVQSVLFWNERRGASEPMHVTVVENYRRGIPEWLLALRGDPNVTLLEHDISRPLPPGPREFQYIVHAAGIASPTYYRRHPIETMDTNINGLRHLLEYARSRLASRDPVRGFLYYSSSEIYGDPPPANIPTPEDYRGNVSCTGPRACYDESKRYGETLCVNFARQYGVPVTIARPFNNYGPGLKITDGRVIADFARDVLFGRDIVLLSDGSPRRTFCYSADAVAGYYKVLVKGRPGEPYNIGVEKPEISMAELAERVASLAHELFGYRGRVVRRESAESQYLVDNPSRRCPVIDKARTELGYDPVVHIGEGLRRALVWYGYNRTASEA
ncbi:MAG TPA: NAD-dependent epimerase/dehydratase family protein [Candidatus Limnocylindria bacterium]|nr:NAD-dependent epimerase/dehydratase family protein [Candidatus Limnocylindria bacterium]